MGDTDRLVTEAPFTTMTAAATTSTSIGGRRTLTPYQLGSSIQPGHLAPVVSTGALPSPAPSASSSTAASFFIR